MSLFGKLCRCKQVRWAALTICPADTRCASAVTDWVIPGCQKNTTGKRRSNGLNRSNRETLWTKSTAIFESLMQWTSLARDSN